MDLDEAGEHLDAEAGNATSPGPLATGFLNR